MSSCLFSNNWLLYNTTVTMENSYSEQHIGNILVVEAEEGEIFEEEEDGSTYDANSDLYSVPVFTWRRRGNGD